MKTQVRKTHPAPTRGRAHLFLVAAVALAACSPTAGEGPAEGEAPKYNLVFILTDEMRHDTYAAYGNPHVKAPHLNTLAEESWVFEKAYVTQPLCSPARSSLMTGYYPHQTGVIGNNIPLDSAAMTLPMYLDEGYASAYIGKWHLGDELAPIRGFDQRISTEDGYNALDERKSDYHRFLIGHGYEPDIEKYGIFSRTYATNLPLEHTKSKFMEGEALKFLDEHGAEPFALYLSFLEPHTPNNGPFNDLHDPSLVELDSSYGQLLPDGATNYHRIQVANKPPVGDREHIRKMHAKYWGLVHQVDLSVGAVVNKLKDMGVYDNTIIVFTSEHGKMLGKYGLPHQKTLLYDVSAQVPFMLKLPNGEGRRVPHPASQIDLMPTLLSLLGAEKPSDMPGESLVKQYEDPDAEGKPIIVEWNPSPNAISSGRLSECPIEEDSCHRAISQSIRSVVTADGWKLNWSARQADISQLFHLADDKMEWQNLYYNPEYAEKVAELEQHILEWQKSVGDTVVMRL